MANQPEGVIRRDEDSRRELIRRAVGEIREWYAACEDDPNMYRSRPTEVLCDVLREIGLGEIVDAYDRPHEENSLN